MSDIRDRNGPLLGGDLLPEGRVRGFGFRVRPAPDRSCDTLLLEGEESLHQAPVRSVPVTAEGAVSLAPPPHARLDVDHIRKASDVDVNLPKAMRYLLTLPGTAWGAVAATLISTIKSAGHFVWISGGAARDMVDGGGVRAVNDLDLAGTAPPGQFTELARKAMRGLGVEHREKISTDLVCSSWPVLGGPPVYEYRTLNMPICRYPASGSDLIEDASTRDFTVNSIYYAPSDDPSNDEIVDPTGRGISDLLARPRRLFSVNVSDDPVVRATNVLRAIKFILRWRDAPGIDLAEMMNWLPDDLNTRLEDSSWELLMTAHHEYLAGAPVDQQLEAACELGPVAVKLVVELAGRVA